MRACFVLIGALVLTTGCASVNYVREAQVAFNEAATADNAMRFDEGYATQSLSASAGYAAAVSSVERLEADNAALNRAKADKLYGVSLAIKAMSQWRLGNWDEAHKAAILAIDSDQLGTRDAVLMAALPGLVRNDQAVALFRSTTFECTSLNPVECGENFENGVVSQLKNAHLELTDARDSAPSGHPVRVYLAISTIAVWENAANACSRGRIRGAPLDDSQAALCRESFLKLTHDTQRGLIADLCPQLAEPLVKKLLERLPLPAEKKIEVCPELRAGR